MRGWSSRKITDRWHAGEVAKKVFGTTTLVHGPESLFAERAVASIVKSARQQEPDVEVNRVSAAELGDGRFLELIGGSLFSACSVVVITDAASLPADLVDQIVDIAANPQENLALIVVHEGGVKGKGLVDKLKKVGVPLFEAAAIKTWELPKFVLAEAKAHRVSIDQGAAQALVDAVGSDARALAGAVSQLCMDAEIATITRETVACYFAGRANVTSFAVADDIIGGRTGQAMEKLRWALSTGVAPVLVTSATAAAFRSLGKYLEVSRESLSAPDAARRVGVPPWKLKDLKAQSRSWSQSGITSAIRAVAKADAEVKGAANDPAFALEKMLLTIAAARNSH